LLEPIVEAVTLIKYPQFFGMETAYESWSLKFTRRRLEFLFSIMYMYSPFPFFKAVLFMLTGGAKDISLLRKPFYFIYLWTQP
jgi:hypothetical protein